MLNNPTRREPICVYFFTENNIDKTDRFPLYLPNIYVARFITSINLGKYLRIEQKRRRTS